MATKFYMDGILDERERILKLIKSTVRFLQDNYSKDEKEIRSVARLQNLHEAISISDDASKQKGVKE